jgi:hypothetical protein
VESRSTSSLPRPADESASLPFARRPVRARDKLLGVAVGAAMALSVAAFAWWRFG